MEVGGGKEAGVRHEALVDGAELVDSQVGIADEAAVASRLLFAEQQVLQDSAHCFIAEPNLVDAGGRAWQKQIGREAVEDQAR